MKHKQVMAEVEAEGYCHVRSLIDEASLTRWRGASLALVDTVGEEFFNEGWRIENVVCKHRELANVIDHEKFIRIPYSLYKTQTKLISSRIFYRTINQSEFAVNPWHRDGPRELMFREFQRNCRPLRIKVAIWLTDVLSPSEGPLTIIPRSHLLETMEGIGTHNEKLNEERVLARAGDVTFLHSEIFHRVLPKISGDPRLNLYLEYGPSWIVSTDRRELNFENLQFLTDRQRSILGDWIHPNHAIKPPENKLVKLEEWELHD